MTAATASVPTDPRITLFGAEWCSDCRRSKKVLDGLDLDYDYVDLEAVADGADRAHAISGKTRIPVIVFPDASHLVEPSDADLRAKLAQFSVEA